MWPALPSGRSLFPPDVVLIWALACYIKNARISSHSRADLHAWGKAVAVKLKEPRAGSLPRPVLQSRWLPGASAKAVAGCRRMCHENPANHPRATHRGGDQRQGEHSASPKTPARGCTGSCAPATLGLGHCAPSLQAVLSAPGSAARGKATRGRWPPGAGTRGASPRPSSRPHFFPSHSPPSPGLAS